MIFISETEKATMSKYFESMERSWFCGDIVKSRKRWKLKEDNRKMAFIKQGRTEIRAWVDNKTNKAYRMDGYEKTWMEIKTFTFVRWMRPMDV